MLTHSTATTLGKPTPILKIRKPVAGRALPGPVSWVWGVYDPHPFSCFIFDPPNSLKNTTAHSVTVVLVPRWVFAGQSDIDLFRTRWYRETRTHAAELRPLIPRCVFSLPFSDNRTQACHGPGRAEKLAHGAIGSGV